MGLVAVFSYLMGSYREDGGSSSWKRIVAGQVTMDTSCTKNILTRCREEFFTMRGFKTTTRCLKRLKKLHTWIFLNLDFSNLKLALDFQQISPGDVTFNAVFVCECMVILISP